LGIQPSLPPNDSLENGKLRIDISQRRGEAIKPAKKSNPTDAAPDVVVPPEGVPTFMLHAVDYAVVVIESKSRASPAKVKRTRKMPIDLHEGREDDILLGLECNDHGGTIFGNSQTTSLPSTTLPFSEDSLPSLSGNLSTPPSDDADILFDEISTRPQDAPESESTQLQVASMGVLKRKRPSTVPNTEREEGHCSSGPTTATKRCRTSTATAKPVSSAEQNSTPELDPIELAVEAAIRISVCNSLRGSLRSFKIKANTFGESLADIAPALWRPGYRAVSGIGLSLPAALLIGVQALSQRVNFAPTLGLSIGRVSTRTTSGNLGIKIGALVRPSSHDNEDQLSTLENNKLDISSISSSLGARFWTHAQKNLLTRPVSTIQPFCLAAPHCAGHVDSDGMLEEEWEQPEGNYFRLHAPVETVAQCGRSEKMIGDYVTDLDRLYAEDYMPDDDELLWNGD
jgi:hypothetical protein